MCEEFVVVDTHVHMFDLKRFPYKWPRPKEEERIYKDFLPQDYHQEMTSTNISYAVLVEAFGHSVDETEWFLQLAHDNHFISGVVGYIDLTSAHLLTDLQRFVNDKKFVGVRQILDFVGDDWLLRNDVAEGMRMLAANNLTFDLLIRSEAQYDSARKFLRTAPKDLRIVIDHLGKPNAKDGAKMQWFEDIEEFSSYPNVYCKLSGMVTEADWEHWKADDFRPYVDHVVAMFGMDRIMFGSDWPVCKLAGGVSLVGVYQLLHELLTDFSTENRAKVFGANAIRFYNLNMKNR